MWEKKRRETARKRIAEEEKERKAPKERRETKRERVQAREFDYVARGADERSTPRWKAMKTVFCLFAAFSQLTASKL